jgi:uncharacterized membrane protein HdeD (DUF308 family)
MRGGAVILEGGRLYQDFIDIKPPALYYIFALSQLLFGTSEMSIRLFDLIWQFATALALYFCIFKISNNKKWAYLSALIYVISYTAINYSQSLQCESFASIFILLVVFFYHQRPSLKNDIFIGACCALLIALKYTFGVVLIAVGILVIIDNFSAKAFAVKRMLRIGIGLAVGLMFGLFPLFDPVTFDAFKKVFAYTALYSASTVSHGPFILTLSEATGAAFTDYYSLLFTILLITGIILIVKDYLSQSQNQNISLLLSLIVINSLLFVSVIVEKKFIPYHFLRLYLPSAIISAYGLYRILIHKDKRVNPGYLLIPAVVLLLVLSPVARYANLVPMMASYIHDKGKYDAFYERNDRLSVNRVQQKAVAGFIKPQLGSGQKVLIMSIGGTSIYNFLGQFTSSKFGQSQFYFSNGAPQEWVRDMYAEVEKSTWIVVQVNDRYPALNGHNRTSLESLKADTFLSAYIPANYSQVFKTNDFVVFKRKS